MKLKYVLPVILSSVLLFTGCQSKEDSQTVSDSSSDASVSEEFDISDVEDTTPVASVGSHVVTYAKYKMTLETYESYYKEVGFDVRQDESTFRGFQERTLNTLLEECVLREKAISEGYDNLDETGQNELNESIEQEIASLGDTYADQIEEEFSKDNSLDKDARLKELIAEEAYSAVGTTLTYDEYIDYIRNYLTEDAYVTAMKEAVLADVTVSEEEVRTSYDSSLASDKDTYTLNPEKYGEAFDSSNEIPPLYAPEGYSKIFALFFSASDAVSNSEYQDNLTQMQEIAQKYGEIAISAQLGIIDGSDSLNSLVSQYKDLYNENNEIRSALAEGPITEANLALNMLKSGESFTDVMEEMGQTATPRAISALYTNDVDWEDSVKEAFSTLTPGNYSDIVETSTGYYIIYYIEDIPSGEYAYDDIHDTIYTRLLTTAREDLWNTMTEDWMAEADTTINEDLMYATCRDE